MAKDPRQKFSSFTEFANDGVKAAPAKHAKEMVTVRVRALRRGYIDLKLRHEDDVFDVQWPKGEELASWMEAVDGSIPSARIPETQETVHLRGEQEPSSSDSVI